MTTYSEARQRVLEIWCEENKPGNVYCCPECGYPMYGIPPTLSPDSYRDDAECALPTPEIRFWHCESRIAHNTNCLPRHYLLSSPGCLEPIRRSLDELQLCIAALSYDEQEKLDASQEWIESVFDDRWRDILRDKQ